VLHLAPEHLGELTLTVDVRAGTVALAVAGQDGALAGLRDGLAQLRTALAEAGLDLGDVSMSTPDRTPDRAPERDGEQKPTADRQNGNRDQPHQSHRGGHGRSAGERSPSGDQRIDITV
jgi:flagellar hook-length control protein FliK